MIVMTTTMLKFQIGENQRANLQFNFKVANVPICIRSCFNGFANCSCCTSLHLNAGTACHALERALKGGCAVRFVHIVAAPACQALPDQIIQYHTKPHHTTLYHTGRWMVWRQWASSGQGCSPLHHQCFQPLSSAMIHRDYHHQEQHWFHRGHGVNHQHN